MLIGSGCHRSSEWRDRLARAALRQLSPANSYSYRRLSDDLPGRPASEGANNSMSMDSKATTTSKTKAASSQYPLGTAAQTRLRLLAALATKARVRSNGDYEVKHCNLCDKPNKEKLDNLWKLLIRPDCSYYCYRCACGGGSSNMKLILSKKGIELPKIGSIDTKALFVSSSKSVTLSVVDSKSAATKNTVNGQTAKKGSAVSKAPVVYAIPNQAQSCSYITSLFPQSLTTSLTNHAAGLHVVDGNQSLEEEKLRDNRRNSFLISARQVPSARQAVMEYLTKERALSPEILQRYGVGCATVAFIDENDQWKEQLCVSFPWTRPIKDGMYSVCSSL